MADLVNVTCYGETKTMERSKAIDFYTTGMEFCDPDSSEYSRYECIVNQLNDGLTDVDDENEDYCW